MLLRPASLILSLAALGLGVAGCAEAKLETGAIDGTVLSHAVAPPMNIADTYDQAGIPALPYVAPKQLPGIENYFRLSPNVASGGEPMGDAAFAELAQRGFKTLLSVDGKAPDASLAAKHGMRYVHIPIQYRGINADELAHFARTFEELEGPFFVHCFHGKHRGPAAAAIGRILVDGVSRVTAMAEMRQWCGTARYYEGLFDAVANADLRGIRSQADPEWSFPTSAKLDSFREVMIDVARSFDRMKVLAGSDFAADEAHPDLDAGNESAILFGLFELGLQSDLSAHPAEMRADMEAAAEKSRLLRDLLIDSEATGREAEAHSLLKQVKAACTACHAQYRND